MGGVSIQIKQKEGFLLLVSLLIAHLLEQKQLRIADGKSQIRTENRKNKASLRQNVPKSDRYISCECNVRYCRNKRHSMWKHAVSMDRVIRF